MDIDRKLFEPEGKRFPYSAESEIKTSFLNMIPAPSKEQRINIVYPEFSAVCPESGIADIATIEINYIPKAGKIIELKSLKYYFLSFRNVGIMQENVTARIYSDLNRLLEDSPLQVVTKYNTRGGIDVVCKNENHSYEIFF